MSLKETIELMFKRFPRCPLCKSDEGYKFSGWIGDYVQCRHCGAKWLLYDWLSDKPMMELVEASKDVERGTVVGHELLRMVYPVSFWQKMKVKRLQGMTRKVEEEAVISEIPPEIPEATEVRAEPTFSMKNVVIALIIIFIVIAGIGGTTYYFQMESLKKPEFNVFDVKPYMNGFEVYVQNIGSKDAHSVEITLEVELWDSRDSRWEWEYYGFKELEILRIGETYKAVFKGFWMDYCNQCAVTVSCEEGVTQKFFFGYEE